MNDTPEQDLDAALEGSIGTGTVRYLKTLVTAMTITTIVALVVLVTVVVMRFSQTAPETSTLPTLPDQITLPDGATAQAVTFGPDWIAVVSDGDILIFDRTNGQLTKRVKIR
ncbi:hypothetical protein GCM10016455_12580 [Aliiroseovarius zhejiangensis]|uniref:Uncharacterized protein n=1 Tax=Aliiroseovarius zhejiangensis TaxID=1632025 RepID=A0ABQ3ITC5_9RHOB|nr:DUF6476 family protein [Aliiroseovarius zhejiangensis]GHE93866.1 hypothetical protein GCM10016455_12580 [Aliiroseovarius zhejiangensis]